MSLNDLSGKKIGILGLGQEGMACARFFLRHNLSFACLDRSTIDLINPQTKAFLDDHKIEFFSGPQYLDNLKQFEIIFRSPGVWRNTEELLDFENNGGIITSQTKWFFDHSPANIIGVTGTKGKGTTASLIFELIETAKSQNIQTQLIKKETQVYLTGNIGESQPFDFLEQLTPSDLVVYELSSFQLQDLEKSPHISVLLMVTEDHLDSHKDLTEYHEAKYNILKHQTASDYAVINFDYPFSAKGASYTNAKIYQVGKSSGANAQILNHEVKFKLNQEFSISLNDLNLRGEHNLENVAAAGLVGSIIGLDQKLIVEVFKKFKGLPHRLKLVGDYQGVLFYDDSFATNPDPTIAAIKSFHEPIHLILGGSEKNADFTNLANVLVQTKNIKTLTVLGKTGPKILEAFYNQGGSKDIPVIVDFTNFETLLQNLKSKFQKGDVVLLSPASASFGLFANYKERGNKFTEAIRTLV